MIAMANSPNLPLPNDSAKPQPEPQQSSESDFESEPVPDKAEVLVQMLQAQFDGSSAKRIIEAFQDTVFNPPKFSLALGARGLASGQHEDLLPGGKEPGARGLSSGGEGVSPYVQALARQLCTDEEGNPLVEVSHVTS